MCFLGPSICADVTGDAVQGGSAAAERRSVDRALWESCGSAGSGRSTPLYITVTSQGVESSENVFKVRNMLKFNYTLWKMLDFKHCVSYTYNILNTHCRTSLVCFLLPRSLNVHN